MLATLVLLLCIGATVVAAGIVFVLIGPLPGQRLGTLSTSMPLPMAAGPVVMPAMPYAQPLSVFDPAQADFASPSYSAPAPVALPPAPIAPAPVVATAVPPPVPVKARRPAPPMAPLRRPRTAPSPLPRTRSARGTEPPRRTDFVDVEHTMRQSPSFDGDEPTFIED